MRNQYLYYSKVEKGEKKRGEGEIGREEKRKERRRRRRKGEKEVWGLRFIIYFYEFLSLSFYFIFCDFINYSCYLQMYFSIVQFYSHSVILFFLYYFTLLFITVFLFFVVLFLIL
jgi:hypothetical protein